MRFIVVASTLGLCASVLCSHTQAQISTPARGKLAVSKPQVAQPHVPGGSLFVGGSDECAGAEAIAGTGTFSVNTVSATTGAPQSGSCPAANRDVWFAWTATSSGLTTIATCGGVSNDSVLAVYDGPGCAGALVACNDDSCGLQSLVAFPATAGSTYLLQFGAFSTSATYSGTFSISVTVPSSNDACATPAAISGVGSFAFDNSAATTGAEGQAEALCTFFGTTAVTKDVWFDWTSPSTGTAVVATCGGTPGDTKIAAYEGSGCPASAAIACNDDACGLQSSISFACVAGQHYTLQLGNYPGTPGAAGTFTIDFPSTPAGCQLDDGVSENSVGLTAGGDLGWFHRFGAAGGATIVSSISAAYGSPVFPGSGAPDGTPVTVYLWDDPNDDGNPDDLVVVASAASAVANGDTDTFVVANLAAPTAVSGVYFAGVVLTHAAGDFPSSLDQTSSAPGRAWVVGSAAGTLDPNDMNAATIVPPTDVVTLGLPGNWLVRADCAPATGTTICESSSDACPCSNAGLAGHGCANSVNASGALLAATGSASIASDTLQLLASGMPNGISPPNYCTFFQGTSLGAGFVFGDGVSCMVAPLVRLGSRPIFDGVSAFGHGIGADPDVHVQGGVFGPATRHYQTTYRNVLTFCTPAGFNITNGVSIVWN